MKSFLQTDWWGEFKARTGWSFERLGDGAIRLKRILPLSRTMYYYPELSFDIALLQRVRTSPVDQRTIFSRFEFLEEYSVEKAQELKNLDLIKSFEEVQPEYRQWVDISGSEKDILTAMKPKGRYNIGVAERSGLEIKRGGVELVEDFCRLYSTTAQRTKFAGRSQGYLTLLVEALRQTGLGEVIIVYKNHQALSGGIFVYYQELASYLYGGSNEVDRSVMAPYIVHWTAIQEAKKRGCKIYDLLAISPFDDKYEPIVDHPYAGITRFKSQFGGRAVRLLGSWDLVHNPFWYKLYKLAERRRRPKNTN